MPTRSIKVKLIVSRKDDGQPLRRALWTTHEAVNAATRYYEERLLLMRGEAYRLGDEEITQASVVDSLNDLIKQAVSRNGGTPADNNQDAVTLLRQLYEYIVPSSIEKDGTAQAANAYIGPLTDPESKGFSGVYDKLARQKPNWVTLVEEEDESAVFKLAVENDEALDIAKAWLETPNADEWMSDKGSPATWIRQARKGEADWPESFVKKLNDLKTEGEQGVPPIIRRLRELHPDWETKVACNSAISCMQLQPKNSASFVKYCCELFHEPELAILYPLKFSEF